MIISYFTTLFRCVRQMVSIKTGIYAAVFRYENSADIYGLRRVWLKWINETADVKVICGNDEILVCKRMGICPTVRRNEESTVKPYA